jgi:1,2-diacylglycerol 3-alpha-glucosyltransferase
MKIAWISSWPPRHCGIATYSLALTNALREQGNDLHIVCHTDGGSPEEKNVYPIIDTQKVGWDETLYETVSGIQPDLVHIQHEYGLYQTNGDHASSLFRPFFRFRVDGRFPVVVTFHSVYTSLSPTIREYMHIVLHTIDAGIVHAEYQWASLLLHTGSSFDNVYVIPHGAESGLSLSGKKAREALGLSGNRVIGMIGWFEPTKSFHRVIDLWDGLASQLDPNTVLVLAGDARMGASPQIEYKHTLLEKVKQCREKHRIKLILGSFSPSEYLQILASFDVMVMPYRFASQSGNLANSFALGVPVIASGLEGLKAEIEASGAGIAVTPGDDLELKRAILTMMGDDTLRKRFVQKARTYVKKRIAWPLIAGKHMKLYKKLVQEKHTGEKDVRRTALLE